MNRDSEALTRFAVLCLGLIVGLAAVVTLPGCKKGVVDVPQKPAPLEEVREKRLYVSPLAGQWYQADRDLLKTELDGYLSEASTPELGNVFALILPHAGYRYSGQTAAYGLKSISGQSFKRVVVLGPSHRTGMKNVASVPNATHYATPFGEVLLDVDFMESLTRHPQFSTIPRAHDGEHSVQIELPLFQLVFVDFKFVPIVVGALDLDVAGEMAKILTGLLDENTLVVASSDFTHYGNNFGYVPFRDNIEENLKELDMGAVERIERKDPKAFFEYIEDTGATICGRYPISVLLAMLPGDAKAHMLHYDTSGRITGSFTNSVSYLSIAFTGKWPQGTRVEAATENMTISPQDKEELLRLARQTLTQVLTEGKAPTPDSLGVELTPCMKIVRGAFVTLEKDGVLRGCIGDIYPYRPLYEAVAAHALNAGLNDRRFRPVDASELDALHFEISALTQPYPVASYDEIELGKHGIVLEKQGHSAVFLPQVAPEQGWTLEDTLTHLSQKAGLPPDAWKEGTSFSVFEAEVFEEGGV